jgi:hypothetical protein
MHCPEGRTRGRDRSRGHGVSLWTPLAFGAALQWWIHAREESNFTLSEASIADGAAFGTGSWTRTLLPTVNSDTIAAPDGTLTADGLVESVDGGNVEHHIGQSPTNIAAGAATFAVSLKAGARQWVLVAANNGTAGAWFDLTNGAKGTEASAVGSIVSQGNGWYRCTIAYTHAAGAVRVYAATSNGTAVYTGNGSTAFYAHNAVVAQSRVAAWLDLSGNGRHLSQGTAANQPQLVRASSAWNNRNAVGFAGNSQLAASAGTNAAWKPMHDGTGGLFGITFRRTDDVAAFSALVTTFTTTSTGEGFSLTCIHGATDALQVLTQNSAGGLRTLDYNTPNGSVVHNTKYGYLHSYKEGSVPEVRDDLNGAQVYTGNSQTVPDADNAEVPLRLGGTSNGLIGEVVEAFLLNIEPTAQQRAQLAMYLAQAWAL